MTPIGTSSVKVQKMNFGSANAVPVLDTLAIEEPLEIRLDFEKGGMRERKSVSITMRTPGHDFELAVGFLFTEGMIREASDVEAVDYCGPKLKHLGHSNVVKVVLKSGISLDLKSLERHFYTTSSCGVCGKASIDALKTQNQFTKTSHLQDGPFVSDSFFYELPEKLKTSQAIFSSTGGLHASGLFDLKGELLSLREDVGRHNALDKLIGRAVLHSRLPLNEDILLLSGRVSFELVQKASMAGIKVIAAIGAPSSLAVELAKEMNITLVGFLRDKRLNIYSGGWRIK